MVRIVRSFPVVQFEQGKNNRALGQQSVTTVTPLKYTF